MIEWIRVLGGYGVFLLAMRSLTRLFRRTLNRNLRTRLANLLSSPWRCLLTGFAVTLIFQAAGLSMMTCMALVSAGYMTLQQGFYVMLGAGVSSSLRVWYINLETLSWGPWLVGAANLALLLFRRERFRVALEALGSLGLAMWGLHELAKGLLPASQTPQFQQVIKHLTGPTIAEQSIGVLAGCVLAGLGQSAALVVVLAIALVNQGALQVSQATGLILGANIGTTLVFVVAAWEYPNTTRQLAWARLLARVFGVLLCLALLPQVLLLVDVAAELLHQQRPVAYQLALLHTTFQLVQVLVWGLLPYPILTLAKKLAPDQGDLLESIALPASVRRLFSRSPERCVQECENQLRRLSMQTKTLLDDNLRSLCAGRWKPTQSMQEIQESQFEAIKEAILDLLIRGMRAQPTEAVREQLNRQLRRLLLNERVYTEAFRLRELLREGLTGEQSGFQAQQLEAHEEYAEALRAMWLSQLTTHPPDLAALDAQLARGISRASGSFLQDASQDVDTSAWMFSVYSRLRGLAHLIREIVEDPHGDTFSLRTTAAPESGD